MALNASVRCVLSQLIVFSLDLISNCLILSLFVVETASFLIINNLNGFKCPFKCSRTNNLKTISLQLTEYRRQQASNSLTKESRI